MKQSCVKHLCAIGSRLIRHKNKFFRKTCVVGSLASHFGSKNPDLRIAPLPNVICGTYADVRIACFEDRYLKEDHPIGYLQKNLIY